MACSKFEYVKTYELATLLLPNTYIVVRIDGRAFTKFCQLHELAKPNDDRLISLMTEAACCTVKEFT
jgi:tRNA(His) guanylyltransferase